MKVNTLTGAISNAVDALGEDSKQYQHSSMVLMQVCRIIGGGKLPIDLYQRAMQAAILHDIGKAKPVIEYLGDRYVNYHPVDGYNYLKDHGWSEDVCNVVLHHSFAKEQAEILRKDVLEYYNVSLSPTVSLIVKMVSYADFHTDHEGNESSLYRRYEDIRSRYGVDSDVYRVLEVLRPDIEGLIQEVDALM